MHLDRYDPRGFERGRPAWIEALWLVVQAGLVESWIPGSRHRRWLLRLFGARIGESVVFKPRIRIKFPWRLRIGNHVWIGEGVWIDNLAEVSIGEHSVVSQGAYICTGSHDWSRDSFDLITKPVALGAHCWVGAFSRLCPGTRMEEGSVLAMGSVGGGVLQAWMIYRGNPAVAIKHRSEPAGRST